MIAALYVAPRGTYDDLEGVELWDATRDARQYDGPWPVVAHPPCARWCRLAGLVEARYGHKRGEDDGCFEAALASVRRWGGVLEHPAFSDAWTAFGLPIPPAEGWQRGICGGWVCYVEQGRYGHLAKKATWLYAYGIETPPTMRWGRLPDCTSRACVSWCGNKIRSHESRQRLRPAESAATPVEFRDQLLSIGALAWDDRSRNGRPLMPKSQRAKTPEMFRDELLAIAKLAQAHA